MEIPWEAAMTHVSSSAAYIRKDKLVNESALRAALHAVGMFDSVVDAEVWELLETPHTVVSLQRATTQSTTGSENQPDRVHIESMLQRLLDADLIELSPDS
jgi:hypothetical protein